MNSQKKASNKVPWTPGLGKFTFLSLPSFLTVLKPVNDNHLMLFDIITEWKSKLFQYSTRGQQGFLSYWGLTGGKGPSLQSWQPPPYTIFPKAFTGQNVQVFNSAERRRLWWRSALVQSKLLQQERGHNLLFHVRKPLVVSQKPYK